MGKFGDIKVRSVHVGLRYMHTHPHTHTYIYMYYILYTDIKNNLVRCKLRRPTPYFTKKKHNKYTHKKHIIYFNTQYQVCSKQKILSLIKIP